MLAGIIGIEQINRPIIGNSCSDCAIFLCCFMLISWYNAQQDSSLILQDYLEASLLLQFNRSQTVGVTFSFVVSTFILPDYQALHVQLLALYSLLMSIHVFILRIMKDLERLIGTPRNNREKCWELQNRMNKNIWLRPKSKDHRVGRRISWICTIALTIQYKKSSIQ